MDGFSEGVDKEVYLTDSGRNDMMSGISKRIPGVIFERSIIFDEELSSIDIHNLITSTDDMFHDYELLFHLDPSIDTAVSFDEIKEMNRVDLIREGEVIGALFTAEDVEIKTDYYYWDYYVDTLETDVISVQFSGRSMNVPIRSIQALVIGRKLTFIK